MTQAEGTQRDGRLGGRVAIVTGGAHGIGKAYCLRFGVEGAKVAVLDLDEVGAKEVAREIVDAGGTAIAVAVDVSDPGSVERAVEEVVAGFSTIDILVNNAAMFSVVPMSRVGYNELDVAEFDKMMAVNVRGTWLMCRAVVPLMQRVGSGKVINVSSGAAFKGSSSQIHYVTSKAAILGLTRTLAREVGRDNVNVNAIAPGSTLSEENPDEAVNEHRTAVLSSRALRRVEEPVDLVGTAVFLASSDSDFMTGQTLVVDGGAFMN